MRLDTGISKRGAGWVVRMLGAAAFLLIAGALGVKSVQALSEPDVLCVSEDGDFDSDGCDEKYDKLSAALDDVDDTSPTEIWVAAGEYLPDGSDRSATFSIPDEVTLYGGFPSGGSSFDDRNADTNKTILSGDIDGNDELDNNNAYTVVTIVDAVNATIDGVTITGGNANGDNLNSNFRGGGVYIWNREIAEIAMRNVTVSGNQASGRGGGVAIQQNSRVAFIDSTISRNNANQGAGANAGGGLSVGSPGGNLALTNTIVTGNEAESGGGVWNGNRLTLTNSTVSGNSAQDAGGGVKRASNASGPTVIINSIVWGNHTSAIDWDGSELSVECDPGLGSTFPVGDTTVQCSTEDSLGQTASGSFIVTVEPEPEPDAPRIRSVPDTIVAFPVSPAGVPVDYPMPNAVDPVDGDVPVECDPPPGSWFGIGHNTVTCSATNSLDLTATDTFGISVAPFDSADFSHFDEIANPWFWATWARTDLPVRDGDVNQTWMWGEGPFTESIWEPYTTDLQNPGGDPVFLNDHEEKEDIPDTEREVMYFDKARMEINDPDGDPDSVWYVTNGLLVNEMITGNRQFGDDLFIGYEPSQANVAGDADDINGPTYAALQNVLDEPAQPVGTLLTEQIDRDGNITTNEQWGDDGVEVGHVDDVTEHGIAEPFWEFMNSEGVVYADDELFIDDLFENAYYATGRPVTEPYWANVQVGGEMRDVLLQCFERRCLTYTPGNSEGFIVEAGNVGQHYYQWRYIQAPD